LFPASAVLREPLATPEALPERRQDVDFGEVSKILPRNDSARPRWTQCLTGALASSDGMDSSSSSSAPSFQVPHVSPPAVPAPSVPATGALGSGGAVSQQAPVVAALQPPATPAAPDLLALGQQRSMPPPAPIDVALALTQNGGNSPKSVILVPPPASQRSVATPTIGVGSTLPAFAGVGTIMLCFWLRSRRRGKAAAAFQGLPQVMVPSPFRTRVPKTDRDDR